MVMIIDFRIVTSGLGTAYPSGAPEFTSGLLKVALYTKKIKSNQIKSWLGTDTSIKMGGLN
jgi:hypothetical protein